MEKFVVQGKNKRSCTTDARSPWKKIKPSDERMEQQQEEEDALAEFSHPVPWQKIEAEGLDCDYALLFSKEEADHLFKQLEEEVVLNRGRSKGPGVWKGVQYPEKAGNIWRCRSSLHLFWGDTVSLSMDSNIGIYSGFCHKSNRTNI